MRAAVGPSGTVPPAADAIARLGMITAPHGVMALLSRAKIW
jgi:hypothetical protein